MSKMKSFVTRIIESLGNKEHNWQYITLDTKIGKETRYYLRRRTDDDSFIPTPYLRIVGNRVVLYSDGGEAVEDAFDSRAQYPLKSAIAKRFHGEREDFITPLEKAEKYMFG